jgi:Bacterial Ig domain/Putative Ig domain
MVIREGSACPSLVVCLSERPCPFWATAVLVCLFAFILGEAGCGGFVSSAPATPSAAPPSITTQPASQAVTAGQTATFAVQVTGSVPLSYVWQKNGADIPGATASTYITPAVSTSDNNSQFRAKVSNPLGTVISGPATLTVNASTSPLQVTTSQLPDGTVAGAYSSTLSASGGSTPYTWSLLSGALPTGLTLNTTGTIAGTPTTAGVFRFTVQVSDAVRSTSASLSINIGTPAPIVAITSPTQGATISGRVSAIGTASDTVSLSLVQVSIDNGNYSNASGTNNWSFSLDTLSLSNGFHTISAKVIDAAGISSTSSPITVTVANNALASDCTLFASPSGSDLNSGTTPASPKTFTGAAAAATPGSVVCLHGGTYNLASSFTPPNNGTPSLWIIYKSYGDGGVNFIWTGAADASPMFRLGSGSFPSGPAYLEFRGLNLDGQGNAGDAFFCQGAHHLRFIGNAMSNTGGSGIGTRDCDYLTADHNIINHNGYMPSSTSVPQWYGWTSGISFNSNQWFDNYGGFHNVISNNIVVGEYDSSSNHTDGNGIILDLSNGSYSASTANTPPALIINNVVYGNGGRCIHAFVVTNFWIVNNTCYKNNLDPTLGNAGSFSTNNSHDGYFINDISVAWNSNNPTYTQEGTNANIQYYADLYFGSAITFVYSDPSQFLQADPLFVNPPSLSGGQYATALVPSLLGNGLTLLMPSPARGKGIDPSTLPNLPAAIAADLKKYVYTDINGKARPQGSFDLGAYQF